MTIKKVSRQFFLLILNFLFPSNFTFSIMHIKSFDALCTFKLKFPKIEYALLFKAIFNCFAISEYDENVPNIKSNQVKQYGYNEKYYMDF